MEGKILRKDFAKIISEFAMKRFNLKPDTTRKCYFPDMANENGERKKYAKLACQLGIMGLKKDWSPDVVFRPNETMTRAMVGTTISRILFGTTYNVPLTDKKTKWYALHLKALVKEDILTKIGNVLQEEKRGNIFIMIYRVDKKFHMRKDTLAAKVTKK